MSTPENEVHKVIADTQATIASLQGDVVSVETKAKSPYQRYEVWLIAFVAFVAGLVVMHLVGR
jgi:hypothetical protein